MGKTIKKNTLLDINLILEKINIKENFKIADLGCGSIGYFVFLCAKLIGKNGVVYAVDIIKTSLEGIERKAKQEVKNNIKTIWSDIEKFKATKIDSESLDVALLINTLFQSKNRLGIIRESVRMIKKGGKLLVVDWDKSPSPLGPAQEKRVNVENLKKLCEKFGLKVVNEFDAGNNHYGVLFTKL